MENSFHFLLWSNKDILLAQISAITSTVDMNTLNTEWNLYTGHILFHYNVLQLFIWIVVRIVQFCWEIMFKVWTSLLKINFNFILLIKCKTNKKISNVRHCLGLRNTRNVTIYLEEERYVNSDLFWGFS